MRSAEYPKSGPQELPELNSFQDSLVKAINRLVSFLSGAPLDSKVTPRTTARPREADSRTATIRSRYSSSERRENDTEDEQQLWDNIGRAEKDYTNFARQVRAINDRYDTSKVPRGARAQIREERTAQIRTLVGDKHPATAFQESIRTWEVKAEESWRMKRRQERKEALPTMREKRREDTFRIQVIDQATGESLGIYDEWDAFSVGSIRRTDLLSLIQTARQNGAQIEPQMGVPRGAILRVDGTSYLNARKEPGRSGRGVDPFSGNPTLYKAFIHRGNPNNLYARQIVRQNIARRYGA